MAITPEQRADRRNAIGSSDVAALLGLDPKRTAWSVYCSKVYDIEDIEVDDDDPISLGNEFENVLVSWAAKRRLAGHPSPPKFPRCHLNYHAKHPKYEFMAANLDGLLELPKSEGIEAKFTGLRHEWGEPGTDQVPERVVCQVHHQMACAELEVVHVPVLYAEFDRPKRQLYHVERNPELIELVEDTCVRFWQDHVVPRKEPEQQPLPAEEEMFKRIVRRSGAVAEVDPRLVEVYQLAKKTREAAETTEDCAKVALLAGIGDAEVIRFGGEQEYTYFKQASRRLDRAALEAKHPKLAKRFITRTEFRVLRERKIR